MTKDIALIVPNWRWDDSPLAVDTLRPPPCPPIEFAYLASGLDPESSIIIDAYVENLTIDQLSARIDEIGPHSVVVNTTPSLLYWRCPPLSILAPEHAIAVAKLHNARTIAIGPHPTYSPSWFVERTGVDIAFRGSPERRLINVIVNDSVPRDPAVWDATRLSSVAVEHAADLPIADFGIINFELPYAPHMWCVDERERQVLGKISRSALVEASRGCPWSCSYCAKGSVRDKFERRPVDRVIKELECLASMGINYVFFIDETFNIISRGFDDLLSALKSMSLSFGFQGRPELITPHLAEKLAASGCIYAELGIDVTFDSFSTEIGRRQKSDSAKSGISRLAEVVPIVRFNRLNLHTLEYRERLAYPIESSWSYPADPAFPYPGSPLGEAWTSWHGALNGEFDWEKAERYSWWLRLEVIMQRSSKCPQDNELRELMNTYLAMSWKSQKALASQFESIGPFENFHKENLLIQKGLLE